MMTTHRFSPIALLVAIVWSAQSPVSASGDKTDFQQLWERNPGQAIQSIRDRSAELVAAQLLSAARTYRSQKHYTKAESIARAALVYAKSADELATRLETLDPELVRINRRTSLLETVYIELISIIREQNLPGRIQDAYGEAISDIDTPYLFFRRAKWQADRGNLTAAIDDMSSAEIGYRKRAGEETDPLKQRWLTEDANEAIGWRGHFHSLSGNYKQALVDIDVALQNEYNKGRWLAHRAQAHARANNRGAARIDAEKAIRDLQPDTRVMSEDPRVQLRANEAGALIEQMQGILQTN